MINLQYDFLDSVKLVKFDYNTFKAESTVVYDLHVDLTKGV